MISNRNLSKKKKTTQNISISPYLKDWIKRYVKNEAKKNPEDDRFKSISSFYNYVLEEIMLIFKEGKTLNDIEKVINSETKEFYDKFTFKAVIPLYELFVEMNKYQYDNLSSFYPSLIAYLKFIDHFSNFTLENIIDVSKKFGNFLQKNKVTKDISFKVFDDNLIVEYYGNYPNIHHEHTKTLIILASSIGLRIKQFYYDKNYSRIIFEKSKYFNNEILPPKLLREVGKLNLKIFLNYFRMIRDKTKYLWSDLSNNKEIILSFKNKIIGYEYMNSIIEDMRNYASKDELKLGVLKMLEHFHWVTILDEDLRIFEIDLPEKNEIEHHLMKKALNSVGIISNKEELLFLE